MPSTTIARGNSLSTFYIQINITPSAVATAGASQNFPVAGLLTTDNILVIGYAGTQTNGVVAAEADCLTAGVLTIQWLNATGASATPAAGNYVLQIVRSEGPLPATAV